MEHDEMEVKHKVRLIELNGRKTSLVGEKEQLDAMMKLGAEMTKNTEDEEVIGELALMKMQHTIFTEMFTLFSKYCDIYKESKEEADLGAAVYFEGISKEFVNDLKSSFVDLMDELG